MLGTVVNSLAIVAGGAIGLILGKGVKEKYKETIISGLGLAILIIGIMNALESNNFIVVVCSIAIGSFIGEWIDIEARLEQFGHRLEKRFSNSESNIAKGFITTTLIYCVGAMAIVGALESGLMGSHETLFTKSILDGISSIIFASTMGIGVIFSAVSVFLYQGFITVGSSMLSGLFTEFVIADITSIGGILILGIAMNVMEIKKIKVGNMLPALACPIVYYFIVGLL